MTAPEVSCPECGAATKRIWIGKGATVISDSIPGGVLIAHGICHPDGTPRRFDSHTDIRKAAEKAGLQPHVTHMPGPGSDKSEHTTRWV